MMTVALLRLLLGQKHPLLHAAQCTLVIAVLIAQYPLLLLLLLPADTDTAADTTDCLLFIT